MPEAKALTIAGSDSGGGAGIQADLKTFASFGVHGMCAITAITAQNTLGVKEIHNVPLSIIKSQIESVVEDIGVNACKTGMLSNSRIIKTVSSVLKKYNFPIVVDPVMIAESGAYLMEESAIDSLIDLMLPLAYVITPNKYEAERLSGIKIRSIGDIKKASREIKRMGVYAVIIKGGHFGKDATDFLYYKGKFISYKGKRIEGCMHGTGCSFSSAITANIALGYSLEKSVEISKKFITNAIEFGKKIGHGSCPVNPTAWIEKPAHKWNVYCELENAVKNIMEMDIKNFVPEVGMNFAYSIPFQYAKSHEDVAGISGRIVRADDGVRAGEIKFGASRHLSKALLKMMEYDESMRAVLNIKYDKKLIEKMKEKLTVSFYTRQEEPEKIKKEEGKTIPWGIETAIKRSKKIPDVIYHEGDVGKEPMILIFGKNPQDVLKKFMEIID
ncbi:MAG TPA: bifunctional hydroxymethylpyrimidine kinase/phosphomethylpyrimidine kinase [Thermoplasmatales archaeon]|nr:bifunctional hydroxymethylpyrimidine kinase/phosphomethylpyrimidine kinase [Thermoplasmatales archaeon]